MTVVNKRDATSEMIRGSGEFGISLAADGQADVVSLAGSFSGFDTDKFSSDVIKTYPAKKIRAPMIQGAAMNAECKLKQSVDLGDYTAFIGEVVEATHDQSKTPLVYHNGRIWKVQEAERPPLLYVTGTYDRSTRTVKAVGRIRPVVSGNIGLLLTESDKNFQSEAQPDQLGFYEQEWRVDGETGGYTVEANARDMKVHATVRDKR
jgi:flavin reductase (DIM6/NTAB) family NADH-FMN oxidoreductase RutF